MIARINHENIILHRNIKRRSDYRITFFDEIAQSDYFSDFELPIARDLNQYGVAIIPGFYNDIEQRSKQIVKELQPIFDYCKEHGDQPQEQLYRNRIQDGFRFSEPVKAFATDPRIIALLDKLYGMPAFPFQTLNFEYGRQQHFHNDAVHFNFIPERFMCGVWVALEAIHLESGPLCYYPGSHRLPIFDSRQLGYTLTAETQQIVFHDFWNKLVEAQKLEKRVFTPRAGDVLIWAANLLHGGEPILNAAMTRWSQVTHYFFNACDYLTPMKSDISRGRVVWLNPYKIDSGQFLRPQKSSLSTETKIQVPEDFDPKAYLFFNPDVAESQTNPVDHFVNFGHRENRRYKY